MKETFTDEQIDTVLRDNNEEENQIVKLLNTIQEEIQNVTKAKHDLEVEVSLLSEQKNSNERLFYYVDFEFVIIIICTENFKNWSKRYTV